MIVKVFCDAVKKAIGFERTLKRVDKIFKVRTYHKVSVKGEELSIMIGSMLRIKRELQMVNYAIRNAQAEFDKLKTILIKEGDVLNDTDGISEETE